MKPLLFACLILIAFPAMMFAQMTEKQFTAARLEMVENAVVAAGIEDERVIQSLRDTCLLYTSPSPRD